jgi:hypothetical protein
MVLPGQGVDIFRLADLDGCFTIGIDLFERGEISTAFVDFTVSGAPFLAIDFSR